MPEEIPRDLHAERITLAAGIGVYGVIGAVGGGASTEILAMPLVYPAENAEHNKHKDDIAETRTSLNDHEADLNQARGIEGVDYSALEQRVRAERMQLNHLVDTRLPYDEVYPEALMISGGIGLVLGGIVGVVRARRDIWREKWNARRSKSD